MQGTKGNSLPITFNKYVAQFILVGQGIQHPVSSYQASSIQYPVFSFQYQASSIQYQVSSIKHPVSSIQHPVSSIQHLHLARRLSSAA